MDGDRNIEVLVRMVVRMELKSQRHCIVHGPHCNRDWFHVLLKMWFCGAGRASSYYKWLLASPRQGPHGHWLALALAGQSLISLVSLPVDAHSISLSPLLYPHSRGQRIANSEEPIAVVFF